MRIIYKNKAYEVLQEIPTHYCISKGIQELWVHKRRTTNIPDDWSNCIIQENGAEHRLIVIGQMKHPINDTMVWQIKCIDCNSLANGHHFLSDKQLVTLTLNKRITFPFNIATTNNNINDCLECGAKENEPCKNECPNFIID